MKKLSILIPTLQCRAEMLARLMAVLTPQITDEVELLTLLDDGDRTTGAKRNELLARATSEYVAFVDDDDLVSRDYVGKILSALEKSPDVVTFKVMRYLDGQKWGEQIMRMGHTYKIEEDDRVGVYWLFRPTHLCPTRATLAKQVQFKEWNSGEDRDWQERVFPLLKSEVFIDEFLYLYYFRQQTNDERNNRNLMRAR